MLAVQAEIEGMKAENQTAMKLEKMSNEEPQKICKWCNKSISDNDKYATYGDNTYGCYKCRNPALLMARVRCL